MPFVLSRKALLHSSHVRSRISLPVVALWLPRGRLRWRNRGGRTFCFPQTNERSVNSENLKVSQLETKTPFISGGPGGTVFVRDDSVLLEVSVYTDYKY